MRAARLLRSDWPAIALLGVVWMAFCAYTWFGASVVRWIVERQYPWVRSLR